MTNLATQIRRLGAPAAKTFIETGDGRRITYADLWATTARIANHLVALGLKPGDRVCITVAVNREGKTGSPSSEKCADVPQ